MAATLPGLPVELLLKIVEHENLDIQRSAYTTLRASCRELNEKLLHFFRCKYLRSIRISLNEENILRLHSLSTSDLATHVQTINLNISTLFRHVSVYSGEESTDASRCSWFEDNDLESLDSVADKFYFDEDVAAFITNGSCSKLLGEALPAFHQVRCLGVQPPIDYRKMVHNKLADVKVRWLLACKVILWVFFTTASRFQTLLIISDDYGLPVPLSALDVMVNHSTLQTCLTGFDVDFIIDVEEASYPIYAQVLARLFGKLPSMTDLSIPLKEASPAFFKQLAKALPAMHLRSLALSYVTTRYKYLRMFIFKSVPGLKRLILECIDLTKSDDFELLCYTLAEIDPDECLLSQLNQNRKTLRFGILNSARPKFAQRGVYSSPSSTMQSNLLVNKKDEEDFRLLWHDAADLFELGPAWPRSA